MLRHLAGLTPADPLSAAWLMVKDDLARRDPWRRSRRSIHGFSQGTIGRRYLLMRYALPCRIKGSFYDWNRFLGLCASDYDRNHFVFVGPHVAERVRRISRIAQTHLDPIAQAQFQRLRPRPYPSL